MRIHHHYHRRSRSPFVRVPPGYGMVTTFMAIAVLVTLVWPLQLVALLAFVWPFQAARWVYRQYVIHQLMQQGIVLDETLAWQDHRQDVDPDLSH